MENGLYVSLSGMLALQRRLDTVANNIANSSTIGFRKEDVTFESIVNRQGKSNVAYSSTGSTHISTSPGAMVPTGSPNDVALEGVDTFLAVSSPAGMVYTRDGRLQINSTGGLTNLDGLPVLDNGGAPVQINPSRGPLQIARNGVISQAGERVGTLGLFSAGPDTKFTRFQGAGLVSEKPLDPVTAFTGRGVVQGYVENANVNPVLEMTRLMQIQRRFEAISSSMDKSDQAMSNTIRTLGNGRGS